MSDERDTTMKVVDRRRWAHGEETAAAVEPSSRKPLYVEELERKVAESEKQAQEYLGKYRQASQEFEDARARMRKELARDAERSRREVLVSLLEVVDNLDRAIGAATTAGKSAGDPLLQGVEMVQRQFLAKLDGFGVKRIVTEGARFDPLLHEAVAAVPAEAAADEGRIVGIVSHGYRIGDEVLRPALVAVAKRGQPIDS